MDKIHVLQLFGEDEAIELVKKATDKIRKSLGDSRELSPKAVAIRDVCMQAGSFGHHLAKVSGILLGETIDMERITRNIPFSLWAAVVPIANYQSHNYELGNVAILQINDRAGSFKCIRSEGDMGNHIVAKLNTMRLASDDEIEGFVHNLYAMIGEDEIYS